MKQVNIDTVRGRMNELGDQIRRGGLSLREEFELACLRQLLDCLQAKPVFEVEVSGNHWLNAGPVADSDFSGMPDGVNKLYAAHPAPVVPDECPAYIRDLMASHSDALFNDNDAQEIWNACRDAMLQAIRTPVAPAVKITPWTWQQANHFVRSRDINFPVEAAETAVRQFCKEYGLSTRVMYKTPPEPEKQTFDEWCETKGQKPVGWVKEAMREAYEAGQRGHE